jgi:hypothetical protein
MTVQDVRDACSKVWGHLMMAGDFEGALQFASALKQLSDELKDEDLIAGSRAMMRKSCEEISRQASPATITSNVKKAACSFCGKEPPEVKLGAGAENVFICNECVAMFGQMFTQ